eukprot:3435626-Alexandrium_andersonii.AAC.1
MSASLVGSEMCIRDSYLAGVPPLVPAWRHARAVQRFSPYCLVGWEPVSYTHLTLPTICSV